MSWIFGAAATAALIKMACPHCGEIQARARKPPRERYRCRKCHKLFTRDEGEKAARKRTC